MVRNGEPATVVFVGAGPGDPNLITVAGRDALAVADVVLYAGSLVNPELLRWARPGARVHDTASMDLEETTAVCLEAARRGESVVRLHTGDPALYGAIQEQMVPLEVAGVCCRVIPGVSSAFASAAFLGTQLTLPDVSQTVIFTRLAGRTPVPEAESLERLASTGATLCVFLSVDRIGEVVEACRRGGLGPETPAAVVHRASWPDESAVTGTLADIAARTAAAGIDRQAMILIGEALRPRLAGWDGFERSRLYAPEFSHGFRRGRG
ncbi:MAG: precorrin-4 C(11)-methyltransferase [Deltaproteobacteria bacterium]|nr:precorrin-4 C(11)-methyltransferase [Deltaproteobacteria bacterium]